MSSWGKSNRFAIAVLLTVTAFSCSLPLFNQQTANQPPSGSHSHSNSEKKLPAKPARLSGVLEFQDDCQPGYYVIKLQGMFDGANIQVETQTDPLGRFRLEAPPGHYLMIVTKDNCGNRESIELERNTEHMVSVIVRGTKKVEKTSDFGGRLPASVLIEPKR